VAQAGALGAIREATIFLRYFNDLSDPGPHASTKGDLPSPRRYCRAYRRLRGGADSFVDGAVQDLDSERRPDCLAFRSWPIAGFRAGSGR
jgi:hypothetical protein